MIMLLGIVVFSVGLGGWLVTWASDTMDRTVAPMTLMWATFGAFVCAVGTLVVVL